MVRFHKHDILTMLLHLCLLWLAPVQARDWQEIQSSGVLRVAMEDTSKVIYSSVDANAAEVSFPPGVGLAMEKINLILIKKDAQVLGDSRYIQVMQGLADTGVADLLDVMVSLYSNELYKRSLRPFFALSSQTSQFGWCTAKSPPN